MLIWGWYENKGNFARISGGTPVSGSKVEVIPVIRDGGADLTTPLRASEARNYIKFRTHSTDGAGRGEERGGPGRIE